jgi:N-acyl-D-aspartate/D-glutamate deacylase
MRPELLIRSGLVYDGAGSAPHPADIAVADGTILEIGALPAMPGVQTLDASGCAVAPGFIDIHTHSDCALLADGRGLSKLHQGVTTEVVGNCGLSAAPLAPAAQAALRRALFLLDVDPSLPWDWRRFGEYLSLLEKAQPAINVAGLVGHVPLRAAAMGFDDRTAHPSELQVMIAELCDALDAGAFGFSTGLVYTPACFAGMDELVALCRPVREAGALFAIHLRDYVDGFLGALNEGLAIARQSGARIQISHVRCIGARNRGTVQRALEILERARSEGLDCAGDAYPYTAGSANLSQLLPAWLHEGGPQSLVGRLGSPEVRKRVEVEWGIARWWDWDAIVVNWIGGAGADGRIGKSILQLAEEEDTSPEDAYFDLIEGAEDAVSMVAFGASEDDTAAVLQHDLIAIASDGQAIAPDGPLATAKPHPRYYGTFPRVLAMAREQQRLSLERAIWKMTGYPAARLGLSDRGLLKPGMKADITIFRAERVIDGATYGAPHTYPEGIEHVLVNGKVALSRGVATGVRAGQILRRGG